VDHLSQNETPITLYWFDDSLRVTKASPEYFLGGRAKFHSKLIASFLSW
jgi:hypothetical protein